MRGRAGGGSGANRAATRVHFLERLLQTFPRVIPRRTTACPRRGRLRRDARFPARRAACPIRRPDGGRDRRGIEVETVHRDQWVDACDRDARPPQPAGQVGHPRRRLGAQPAVDFGDRGQPLVAQEVRYTARLSAAGPPAPRPAAGERCCRGTRRPDRASGAHDVDRPVSAEAYVVAVDQHRGVRGGQAEPARRRIFATSSTSSSPLAAVLQPLPKPHPSAQAEDPAGRRRCLEGPNTVAVKNELLGEREVRESSRKYGDQDPSPAQSWANCCDRRAALRKRQR
jgi:hypothetical protein